MGRVCLCAIAFLLYGCATIKEYAPTTERPFCYGKLKYTKHKKEAFIGLRCHW